MKINIDGHIRELTEAPLYIRQTEHHVNKGKVNSVYKIISIDDGVAAYRKVKSPKV